MAMMLLVITMGCTRFGFDPRADTSLTVDVFGEGYAALDDSHVAELGLDLGLDLDPDSDGCIPAPCDAPDACGLMPDGCGAEVDCGVCLFPETCGGSGVAHRCGAPEVIEFKGAVVSPWGVFASWGSGEGGGISESVVIADAPVCAFDDQGRSVVAWGQVVDGQRQLFVKRLEAERWLEVSGSATGGRISQRPDDVSFTYLATHGSTLYVAGIESYFQSHALVRVFHHDGATWGEVTGGATNAPSNPRSMALDVLGGEPLVIFDLFSTPTSDLFAMQLSQGAWTPLGPGGGGISNTTGYADAPHVAVDASGRVIVAWTDSTTATAEIYIRRYDGATWQEIGAGSASGEGISVGTKEGAHAVRLTTDLNQHPIVAWREGFAGNMRIFVRRFDGNAWGDVGVGSAFGEGISGVGSHTTPQIAVDASNRPMVVWNHDRKLVTKRFDNGAWEPLGGGSLGEYLPFEHQHGLCLDAARRPLVVWKEQAHNSQIYGRQLQNDAWVGLGKATASGEGLSASPGTASTPTLLLDAGRHPMLAWVDTASGESEIYVRRYDGSSWVDVGLGSSTGGGVSQSKTASTPHLAMDDQERPTLAWITTEGVESRVHLKRFQGGAWVSLGPAAGERLFAEDWQTYCGSLEFRLITPQGATRPTVSWTCGDFLEHHVFLKQFDGQSWVGLAGSEQGLGVASASPFSPLALGFDAQGHVLVGWIADGDVMVSRFDGAQWIEQGTGSRAAGGLSHTGSASWSLALAVDGVGRTVMAWRDKNSGTHNVYLRRLEGDVWVEIGLVSATAGGLSKTGGVHGGISIVFDAQDNPIITWLDDSSTQRQVYTKRYTGAAWSELVVGSASGGGLSASGTVSTGSVAIARDGLYCASWSELAGSRSQVLMRCALMR